MKRASFILFFAAVVLVLLPVKGFSQAISGNVVGTIEDTTGAVIPNANVTAVNEATGVSTTTRSIGSGEYRFDNLPVGTYDLNASAQGMAALQVKGVVVQLNQTVTANLKLQVGTASTTVEVSAAAPLIDTTTAQVQTTYNATEAKSLPTANLNVLNLSLLSAGVSSGGGLSNGAGVGPSVGGARPRNNDYTIDGVDNNNKTITGPLVQVPNDAVANFTVLQNQYSPEFGHSSGGQFNTVVQSGTSTYHGTLYEYFQNRDLNAVDQSLVRQGIFDNPRFDNNRFGGNFGGPILKNKLFFFADYEYNPIGQAATPSTATLTPTAAGYAALAALPGVSKTNLGVLQQFVPAAPAANGQTLSVLGANIPLGVLPIVAPNFTNNQALVTSMDYIISDHDQVRGRYIYNRTVGIDTAAQLGEFFQNIPQKFHLATVSEEHTFSSTLNNEFRIGFNRFEQTFPAGNFKFPGVDSFPNLTFDDLALQVGPDPNAPQFTIQNEYSTVDNVTWVKGNHTFQFGAEARKYISPQSFTQRSRGDYEYSSVALFLQDLSPDVLGERSKGNPIYYGDQIAFYWYVNDNWKIRPNITLNFGLRHEYTTIPFGERSQSLNQIASVPGVIDFSEPRAPKDNFAPRIGIAWSPGGSGTTSIRAGFGMAYDVLFDNIGILQLPPELSQTQDVNLSTQTPNFLAGGGLLPGLGGVTVFPDAATARAATGSHIPVDQKDPVNVQWNLGIQHVFHNQYTVEVRYLGNHGYHQNFQDRINSRSVVTATNSLPLFLSAPTLAQLNALPLTLTQLKNEAKCPTCALAGLDPGFAALGFNQGFITQYSPLGSSIYHGLAVQGTRRFSNGLQFQAAYTYSHLIDNSTADFFSTFLTPRRPQDFQNVNADRSNSALDHRHRFTLAMIYDLPYFKHSNWLARNLLGNWEAAPIYTYESGEWADVQSSRDANLNGDSAGDRVFFNPSGVPGTGSDVTALKNSAGATVAYLAKDPTAQYIRAGSGMFANSSRNTLSTPPIDNFDFNLVKSIAITERYQFKFGAQFFNLFNHPQFISGGSLDQYFTVFSTTGAGVKSFLTPGATNFNQPNQTFASNARTMQLSAKFIF